MSAIEQARIEREERLEQFARLAQEEHDFALGVGEATQAQAAAIGLTAYRAWLEPWLADPHADPFDEIDDLPRRVRENADPALVAGWLAVVERGSDAWQVWAPVDEWEAWHSEHEADRCASLDDTARVFGLGDDWADFEQIERDNLEASREMWGRLGLNAPEDDEARRHRQDRQRRLDARKRREQTAAWQDAYRDLMGTAPDPAAVAQHDAELAALAERMRAEVEQIERDMESADEHERAVERRAEQLRVDADAKRVVAVERGGFGLFDPSATLDVLDLGKVRAPASLIEDVLERGQIGMIFADGYVGKSFLVLDWACRITLGIDWLGQKVATGRVLYLAMEGHTTFPKRLAAWEEHNGRKVDRGRLVVYPKTVNLLDRTSLESLADYQRREQFDLIVVDTLNRSIGGADENSTELMGQYIAALSQLREAHEPSHVLAVHHSKKAEPEQYRGASVLYDGFDSVICMRRVVLGDGEDERKDPRRRLVAQKHKSGMLAPVVHLTFEQVPLTDSAVLVRDAAAGVDPVARHLLTLGGKSTRKALAVSLAAAGLYGSEKSAAARITKLIGSGALDLDGDDVTIASAS